MEESRQAQCWCRVTRCYRDPSALQHPHRRSVFYVVFSSSQQLGMRRTNTTNTTLLARTSGVRATVYTAQQRLSGSIVAVVVHRAAATRRADTLQCLLFVPFAVHVQRRCTCMQSLAVAPRGWLKD